MRLKRCSKCKRLLPLEMFHKNKTSKDGLNLWCKECVKRYYRNNREHKREYNRKYYQEHKEHIRKYIKQWNQANETRLRKRREKRRWEIKEYNRQYLQTPNGKAAMLKAHVKRNRKLSFIPLYPVGTPCLITGSRNIHYHHYTDKYVIPIDSRLHRSVGSRGNHRERIKELLGPKLVEEIEERIRKFEVGGVVTNAQSLSATL